MLQLCAEGDQCHTLACVGFAISTAPLGPRTRDCCINTRDGRDCWNRGNAKPISACLAAHLRMRCVYRFLLRCHQRSLLRRGSDVLTQIRLAFDASQTRVQFLHHWLCTTEERLRVCRRPSKSCTGNTRSCTSRCGLSHYQY